MLIEEKSHSKDDFYLDSIERMRSGSFQMEQENFPFKPERKESNMSDLFGENSIPRELALELGLSISTFKGLVFVNLIKKKPI